MEPKIILMLIVALIGFILIGGVARQRFGKTRYWVDIKRPNPISNTTSKAVLMLEPFSIDSEFRTKSIVSKKTARGFETDFYISCLISPAQMMTEQTLMWLRDSGLFARVIQPGSYAKETHVLKGHIDKVYYDTFTSDQPLAQFETTICLMNTEKREEALFSKTYTSTEIMSSPKMEEYFNAQKTGVTEILKQLEVDLSETLNRSDT